MNSLICKCYKLTVLASVFFIIIACHSVASAKSDTTFQVNAEVVASCTVTATNLSFGSYTLSQLDATSTITTTCTSGADVKIGLNAGTGSSATVKARKMTSSGNTLEYGLYQDSGRSTNWGNTPGTDTKDIKGTGEAQVFTVYGRIPANQSSPIGTYTDTITVTVNFS